MQAKSFKLKIFVMFALLAAALSFFSAYFIYSKYQESLRASTQVLSAHIGKSASRLIHAVQIERGLNSGYVAQGGIGPSQKQLLLQYDLTDKAIKDFFDYSKLKTPEKKNLEALLSVYNAPHKVRLRKTLKRLKRTRDAVLAGTMPFEDVIRYYSLINRELLDMYYGLLWLTRSQYSYGTDLYRLERIKEGAGMERAYIYNQLLTRRYFLREISMIRHLISIQTNETKMLMANMPEAARLRYKRIVTKKTHQKVQRFRKAFFQYKLTYRDAPEWFRISTERIDELEKLSIVTTDNYLDRMMTAKHQADRELYAILILAGFAFFAFVFLVYMLNRLLVRTENLLDDLRIASFAFDSHEAMAITDTHGTILKVNKAFTEITGYSSEEAVGQNPSILQSGEHSESFYREMWSHLFQEGYWRGEIINKRKNGERYEEQLSITAIKDAEGTVTHFISQFLDISDLKKAEAEALHQATHDFLTQLPNRKSMLQKLKEEYARAQRHHFLDAFLFLDIDDFKKVNDVYGHAVGDMLLVEVARRLQENIREEDYAARISGDEFCVILVDIGTSEQKAASAARKASAQLLQHLDKPYLIDDLSLSVGVSVGIKLFPDHNQEIEEVISNADTAMYQAKDRGKNRFVFYDRVIEQRVRELSELEGELRAALETDALVFHYQPKVGVESGTIVGAELLVRWEHPVRGILYPDTFLEALQNISMMPRLSEMALETACRFLVTHKEDFKGTLSINVTATELRTDFFVQMTQNMIHQYGVDPGRIEIEILENDLIEDFDAVISRMNTLKEFGVKFSIDDFGIGYSSINYLYTLPADTLKIDRDFVLRLRDKKTQEMVNVIIKFAKVFGMKTVLEGVDETYQLDFAREHGASMYQGYYFSQAVDEQAFIAMLGGGEKTN